MYKHITKGKGDSEGIEYRVYTDIHEWADNELRKFPPTYVDIYHRKWLKIGCGFDIETTTVMSRSFMYHWQFSWGSSIVLGRTWSTFESLIEMVQYYLDRKNAQIICWVANLAYEFSFLQHRFEWKSVFARDERHPIKAQQGRIQYRDCLFLSGQGGLATLAKNYTTTQKAVGDIDHRQIRNSQSELNELETGYCIADVAILSEWADYCFNRWCRNGKRLIPLTKTGIVRDSIADAVEDREAVENDISAMYPQTKEEYNYLMAWLFRGGYTHANVYHVGDRLSGIIGADFTSSYPAVMLHDTYPVSCFLGCELDTDGRYITDSTIFQDCVWMLVKITGIRSKTMHHIESCHKIYDCDGLKQDNGRMIKADWVIVALTELDYFIYCKFYEWDSLKVIKAYSAERGKLPDYVTKPLMDAYTTKQKLKASGQDGTVEYINAKAQVNSFYGCMVQRLNFDEITWTEEGGWDTATSDRTYDQMRKGAILLPQWGIWVTAWARFHLLMTVIRLDPDKRHNSVVYCDTDSIYMIDTPENRKIIEDWNQEMLRVNSSLPKEFSDIGCFDWIDHGAHWDFKSLGAKRYVKYDPARQLVRVTVAGLRIGSYENMLLEDEKLTDEEEYIDIITNAPDGSEVTRYLSIDEVFRQFRNELLLDRTISMKTTTRYHDTAYSEEVFGEIMSEKSGCCIFDIPFQLKMSEMLIYLIQDEHKGRRKPII